MNWSTIERVAYAGLAGAVAVAVPPILYWTVDYTGDSILAAWFVAPFLGPLVFQLISRRRPEWGWGLAFAALLGVVFGIWGGVDTPFEEIEGGQAVIVGLIISLATFLAGMVGASAASLIGRAFDDCAQRHGAPVWGFRPWHVGVAILGAEVVTVAAIAVALG